MPSVAISRIYTLLCLLLLPLGLLHGADQPYFHIQVQDEATGRGVPLVELETVNSIVSITDNNGNIAFHEPGLMDQTVFFHVRSHGYEFAKDGFGYHGTRLKVTPDGQATLKIKRVNLSERLYRITGAGRYRDTILLGKQPPVKEPLLNAQVVGSDSVVNGILNGKLHWFWGDTLRPSYPLGNFQVPGATSRLPADGGLDPAIGIDLDYYTDPDGFAKQTAKMPGPGPTWIFGAGVLKNAQGTEELWTGYMKVEPPLKVYARGVARFNPERGEFERVVQFPSLPILHPEGQTLVHRDNDVDYLHFCQPYPLVRVPATPAAYQDPSHYEAFTCLKAGSTEANAEVERDATGRVHYTWKKNTAAVTPGLQKKLVTAGQLKPDEAWLRLRDRDTGKAIIGHTGSVNWNSYRKRWIMVCVEHYGKSLLGEVWYSEADSPLGPWNYAVKIMTHEKYSFYNPKQHPYFDQQDGRLIYFEGTYTQMFSGNPVATPRYEYNQMMYRLDLGDPRVTVPVPIYQTTPDMPYKTRQPKGMSHNEPILFLACDQPGPQTVPIYSILDQTGKQVRLSTQAPSGESIQPTFYALPANLKDPPATVAPLYEFTSRDGAQRSYSLKQDGQPQDFQRSEKPICLVWKP